MPIHREKIKIATIKGNCTIKQAMKAIDDSALEVVLIIDDDEKMVGLATDGDIRRAIIKDATLDTPVNLIMNRNFLAIQEGVPKKQITKLMKDRYIKLLPILDVNGKIIDVVSFKDIWHSVSKENKVVLMAGGLGTRLRPLTDDVPKPMLNVGGKPMLELIINRFREQGYSDIIITLNYKGDIIEKYFQDGSDFDVDIEYVIERKRLGTAGAIKLARKYLNDKPFFVMNSDLLTKVNFERFMDDHINQKNELTVAIKPYDYSIPYGVVNLNNGQIKALQEKPSYSCLVSAGIYCLNPTVIDLIPDDTYCDITDIINKLIQQEKKVGSFMITEYWMDIGTLEDYDRAMQEIAAGKI
jgi:dTDP-glucose pyrophosphorylase/CBS domain-containing protein